MRVWAPVALVIVLALFPLVFPGELNYLGLGFLTFIFVTLAVSWNMVGGYAGQVSPMKRRMEHEEFS
jgi:ABC-type branched-subunit amino acid transport system permease subunit